MTYIPEGDAEVALYFEIPGPNAGRRAVMTFGVNVPPTLPNLQTCMVAYKETVWDDLGTEEGTFVRGTMRDGVSVYEYDVVMPGGHAGELPPPNVSLLVKKVTGVSGRENRGRFYPPGLVYENTYDNSGVMSVESQGDYNLAFANFLVALGDDDISMVLHHNAEILATGVDALVTSRVASTQRRRLRS